MIRNFPAAFLDALMAFFDELAHMCIRGKYWMMDKWMNPKFGIYG